MKDQDITLWDLENEGGNLAWGGCSLAELVSNFDTPLFVFNKHRLEKYYGKFRDCFHQAGLDTKVFFSVKTNPVPDFLRQLIRLGCGLEVISDFELRLSKSLGITGDKIIVNGTFKSNEFLSEVVDADVALINIECAAELKLIQNLAYKAGKKVNVGLRINPKLKVSPFNFTASTGSNSSYIGLLYGSREWQEVISILKEDTNLRLRGLHFHIGSGIGSLKLYDDAITSALKIWKSINELGFKPTVLDIGGGFSVASIRVLSFWDLIRLYGWGGNSSVSIRQQEAWSFLTSLGRLCASRLHTFCKNHGIEPPQIYVEPGRALAGPTALLLLSVKRIVERGKEKLFAVCDAGALSISPLLLCEHHAIFLVNNRKDSQKRYDLVGSLPTPLDFIGKGRWLPSLSSGDIIAIMDVGAYFPTQVNTFAGPRPAMAMIYNSTATLIRRRETYDDLLSRDIGNTDL